MSTPATINDLLERNKEIAKSWEPLPYYPEFAALGISTPKMVVLCCADPRCVPERFLGLKAAEAAVFRNVCGHADAEIHAILALDTLMNLDEIMVVHHTDCGAFQFTDDGVEKIIKERAPSYAAEVDKFLPFGAIKNLEQSVRADVAFLKSSPLMRKELADRVRGFTFDIKTGLLAPVE